MGGTERGMTQHYRQLQHKQGKPIRINRHFVLDVYPDYLLPERFIRAFQATWQRLPLSVRRRIAAYRRKEMGTLMIVEELDKRLTDTAPAGVVARRHLEFLDACLFLTTTALEFTIAHELAHLFQYAIGAELDEDEANEMVVDWFGLDDDCEYWQTEGMVWMRYVVRMFDGTRADSAAEIRAFIE